ncbi:tetraacyldisaccharide 4'-kinase [bacterium]|nr:tetraacyldisaccharide 4'-kinase [bacterium]
MVSWLETYWYTSHWTRWLLWPAALVYQLICFLRRRYLQWFGQQQFTVPIIVVGNLSVGGVGKTPLVIALAEQLRARGLRVGIVSRGYGATVNQFPYDVKQNDCATLVGDEPLLLAKKTGCPVIIAPKRVRAVQYLLDHYQSQIIISDDGLQHYAMGRAIEIVVVDGTRGLGNGLCLPAGPLRESARRLRQVDFIVVNAGSMDNLLSYRMDLEPGQLTSLLDGQPTQLSQLRKPIAAVAGIGHPQRFFATLQALGFSFTAYPFADHHAFKPADLCLTEKIVVMTEKDAVKCLPFATESMYFLPVEAKIDSKFWEALWSHEQLQGYIQ